MKKVSVSDYKKVVSRDIAVVNRIISNGADLSREEWFDFNFKMALMEKGSINIIKYYLFNRRLVRLADVYADAMRHIMRVIQRGFTMELYSDMVANVADGFTRVSKKGKCFRTYRRDRDGVNYIDVVVDKKESGSFPVTCKSDAVKGIIVIVRYFSSLVDGIPQDSEFSNFLDSFLSGELQKIVLEDKPSPHVCISDSNRLAAHLAREGYGQFKKDAKVISMAQIMCQKINCQEAN